MCEKCTELDEKIAHYRRFTTFPFDPLTSDRIERLIDDLQRIRTRCIPLINGPRNEGSSSRPHFQIDSPSAPFGGGGVMRHLLCVAV